MSGRGDLLEILSDLLDSLILSFHWFKKKKKRIKHKATDKAGHGCRYTQ